jgi:CBS-domain-containing membrane protein
LLRLFDRYPHLVQQKGSTVTFKPKIIALTTTKSPQETFKHHEEDMEQLLRRIDEIIDLDENPMSD